MNDKQFSIGIKISIAIACIILIVIGIVAFLTLRSANISSSVLEDVPNAKNIVSNNEIKIEENE